MALLFPYKSTLSRGDDTRQVTISLISFLISLLALSSYLEIHVDVLLFFRLDGCSYQLCAGARYDYVVHVYRDDEVIYFYSKIRGVEVDDLITTIYVDDIIITSPSA
jgi:hypothetical protein